MKTRRFSALFISIAILAAFNFGCSKDEAPSEPIQPSDTGAVDPNAAALPPDIGVDPMADVDPGDMPASDGIPASEDAVDAPLGTLTEDPWAAPGAPGDIKNGPGKIAGEDIGSSTGADTSGIPSMGDDPSTLSDGGGLGYQSGKKKKGKAPKVSSKSSAKTGKDKKAKGKAAKTKSSKATANASTAASTEGSGSSVRYVKAIQLNIRSAPDRKASMVRRIKGGDQVNVTVEGAWAKLGEGEYVRTKFLSTKQQRVVSEDEIESAWKARGGKKPKAVKSSKQSSPSKPKAKSKKSKGKKSTSGSSAPQNTVPADVQGGTALPPDPNAPAIEDAPEEQMHGDQN